MQVFLLLTGVAVAAGQFINELSDFEGFADHVRFKRKYRPYYHVSAPMGWLNDPAAFIQYNQQYHVFYQYHPYSGAWGHIHWGHVVSENLIEWIHYPPALYPKESYEKHGCLGGSAVVHNNYLTLIYTGTVFSHNRTIQSQNIAISSDGIFFQKYLYNPVIKESPYSYFGVGDFRNPKVWNYRSVWYMIVGAMSKTRQGKLLLYTSDDLFHWRLNSSIAESYGDMGYMWESPDLFELNGQHVLVLSARGIQTDGFRFRNLYQTGYVLGTFNYNSGSFEDTEVSTATFTELDHGHDFYAAHTVLTTDGRRVMMAWLGMWESSFEESRGGWASMMTIPRELRISNSGKLNMLPLKEMVDLRSEILEDAWYSPGEAFFAGTKAFEMIVNSTSGANDAVIILEWSADSQFIITYSSYLGFMTVDRGGADGMRRADWTPGYDKVHWRIFVDFSSIELFCGDGEVVFSSRIYPKKAMRVRIGGDTQLHIVQYRLKRATGFDSRVRKHFFDYIAREGKKDKSHPHFKKFL